MGTSAARATTTSTWGVSGRVSHDASAFYDRFVAPALSEDDIVASSAVTDALFCGDARCMPELVDSCVALVVCSPPYFVGKSYEEHPGADGAPADFDQYLCMLRDVFAECVRTLEPGGRIAVNVANLGRRPYRSLSAEVIRILERDLGLLLRGEIVWQKARGASSSCAWGSFQDPTNPVLRDTTERIVVASKGRFDRAVSRRRRGELGLAHHSGLTRDEFLDLTLDLWAVAPESATRVGHPAPFPVELAARLIELYSYEGDLVLDPFLGSGTTALAASLTGRHWVGYDTDPSFVALAEARLAAARAGEHPWRTRGPDGHDTATPGGATAKQVAAEALRAAGFVLDPRPASTGAGFRTTLSATAAPGAARVFVDVVGGHSPARPGLSCDEQLWRALGRAAAIESASRGRYLVLSTELPTGAAQQGALRTACRRRGMLAAVCLGSPELVDELRGVRRRVRRHERART